MSKKESFKALIVDDEPDIRELLDITLSRMDIDTQLAEDITQAKELLTQTNFDLCLSDMKLPDGNGIDLIRHFASLARFTETEAGGLKVSVAFHRDKDTKVLNG